ncbi:kinetochore protein Spc25 [Lepisosteus oculatus]|uniref:kinetochore protein Spc25 n=1 Tax=Lepisosteus oculatus TaxID=7918 RepID=UPI0003EABC3F|nr:PREDICTED: kinetochore protein Spc25 [Lepisosteus oculatus]XP_015214359.1 PREDICTED: kinetochore protein Spc25 [Lepisosteus oculatus]
MASIKQPGINNQFSKKLEEMRITLLNEVLGDVSTEAELKRVHKEKMKSLKDACYKKCKDDEAMFEKMKAFLKEVEHKNAQIKERGAEIIEIKSEIQENEMQKEKMMQALQKLTEENAKKRELMTSQNKVNKGRLKNLNKAKQVFQESLGLEIRKLHGEKLQFVFRRVNHKDLDSVYTFTLRISEEGIYEVVSCDPPLECMSHLESRLQETNNFSAFLTNVRKEFAALPNS